MKVTAILAMTVGFFFPLPTIIMEGNAKFHLDVSEDENVFFPIRVHGTLDSIHKIS